MKDIFNGLFWLIGICFFIFALAGGFSAASHKATTPLEQCIEFCQKRENDNE